MVVENNIYGISSDNGRIRISGEGAVVFNSPPRNRFIQRTDTNSNQYLA